MDAYQLTKVNRDVFLTINHLLPWTRLVSMFDTDIKRYQTRRWEAVQHDVNLESKAFINQSVSDTWALGEHVPTDHRSHPYESKMVHIVDDLCNDPLYADIMGEDPEVPQEINVYDGHGDAVLAGLRESQQPSLPRAHGALPGAESLQHGQPLRRRVCVVSPSAF